MAIKTEREREDPKPCNATHASCVVQILITYCESQHRSCTYRLLVTARESRKTNQAYSTCSVQPYATRQHVHSSDKLFRRKILRLWLIFHLDKFSLEDEIMGRLKKYG